MDVKEIFDIYENFDKNIVQLDKTEQEDGIILKNKSNVVSGDKLRKIQIDTLKEVSEYLSKTFGPMGSNTKIIDGNNAKTIKSSYSKDGLKVLEGIQNSFPIEMSIIAELIDSTRHVEKEVGDGTTSSIILSSLIFERLSRIQKTYNIPPFQLIRKFKNIVEEIKKIILSNKKECDIEDIYNIALTSTNGEEQVAKDIKDIYEAYGMDVDLSVGISNTADSVLKVYDGLTITEGFSSTAYINNKNNNSSEIHNAHIYHFADPVDTMDMVALFESILKHNIYEPLEEDEDIIPTVITCPKLSRDLTATLKELEEMLYQFDKSDSSIVKPPVLIITNVVASDELIMDDIANLCGCKTIRKYIDPQKLASDQAVGKAPTIDNIAEDFAGFAELVVSDMKKTKFINPMHMHTINADGSTSDDPIYTALINFLESEIEQEKNTENANDIGLLKKRLSALKANTVDYLVGGVTIFERDSKKDLIEDAIKNCKSASEYGVGYAANFEGFRAAYMSAMLDPINEIDKYITDAIILSYVDITKLLYSTVCNDTELVNKAVINSIKSTDPKPYDISVGDLSKSDGSNVKCSIMLDIQILDTISKIITIMVTCNQCLLQAPQLNTY